jgi:hypothetical protein
VGGGVAGLMTEGSQQVNAECDERRRGASDERQADVAAHAAVLAAEARTQVLEHVHVRQRVDLDGRSLANLAQASERVDTVNVHGARAADALAARSAEGERRVHLVLHLDQRVEHHRSAIVQVDLVLLHLRLCARVRIPAVDGECFEVSGRRGGARPLQQARGRRPPQRWRAQAAEGPLHLLRRLDVLMATTAEAWPNGAAFAKFGSTAPSTPPTHGVELSVVPS